MTYDIPFVPSSNDAVKTMLKLADPKRGEKAVDLGAGDGKLVMALARKGINVVGVEIDNERSLTAASQIVSAGLQDRAKIVRGSFWNQSLKSYDLILLYGVTSIMGRLEKKILNEAKNTCRIVSNYFEFPNLQIVKSEEDVHLYSPVMRSGSTEFTEPMVTFGRR